MKQLQKTLSSFEPVTFPDFRAVGKIMAKIDTGAYTGALHCTKIHEATTGQSKTLHFSPFDHPETEIVATEFSMRTVRSSNGSKQHPR